MTDNVPDDMTREEYRNEMLNPLQEVDSPVAQHAESSYLSRTRKATMAGAVALASSLSTAALQVSQDGILTWEEISLNGIIALGFGVAAWFATWAVPNE